MRSFVNGQRLPPGSDLHLRLHPVREKRSDCSFFLGVGESVGLEFLEFRRMEKVTCGIVKVRECMIS